MTLKPAINYMLELSDKGIRIIIITVFCTSKKLKCVNRDNINNILIKFPEMKLHLRFQNPLMGLRAGQILQKKL